LFVGEPGGSPLLAPLCVWVERALGGVLAAQVEPSLAVAHVGMDTGWTRDLDNYPELMRGDET
jgi:hypothetical protein